MPTYAFICEKCGHEFEELVGMGKLAPCPKCKTDKQVKKQLTAPSPLGGAEGRATFADKRGGGGCGGSCSCH